MMLIAAFLAAPVGMVLAAVAMVALSSVLSMSFLVASAPLLPAPIANVVQTALTSQLITSWIGLLIVLLVWLAVTFLIYWVASANVTLPATPGTLVGTNLLENLARGALIGVCNGANFVVLLLLFGSMQFGVVVGGVIAIIGLSSAVPALSNNPTWQVVLAWSALAMPMVWPMTLIGWLFAIINALFAAGGGPTQTPLRLWTRATLIMHGGIMHFIRTAYNLGNLTMAHGGIDVATPWFNPGTRVTPLSPLEFRGVLPPTVIGMTLHESSHLLNVAAFGWIYHLVGWADEYLPMPWSAPLVRGTNAHSELCAESGLRGFGRNFLDMWLPAPPPPAGPAPASNVPAVPAVAVTALPGVVATALPAAATFTGLTVACTLNAGVTMTSAGSADPDAFPRPIGRRWRLEAAPAGSTANVLGTTTGAPTDTAVTFVPDVGGVFTLSLAVTDGSDGFFTPPAPFTLPISLEVISAVFVPVPLDPPVGTPLQLDGTLSTGAVTGVVTPLSHSWTVVTAPPGSALLGTVLTGATPIFTPDAAGPPGLGSWAIDLTVSTDVSPAGGGAPVTLATTSRLTF